MVAAAAAAGTEQMVAAGAGTEDKMVAEAAGKSISFALNSGRSIPALGLGTWLMSLEQARVAIFEAIVEAGYRHVDCAMLYGNEEAVGDALSAAFETGIKREELFITSKVWCTEFTPEDIEPAVRQSLKRLKLDYVDLYLLHWPISIRKGAKIPITGDDCLPWDMEATWRAMEQLVEKGLVKDIGVSNFSVVKLKRLLDLAVIPPAVNQVEMHPVWRNEPLLQFCKSKGVHVTAYSPLGSKQSIPVLRKNRPDLQIDLLSEPLILEIAKKIGRTPAQVLLRWAVQRGTSVVPKSVNRSRLRENIDVLDWKLSQEDVDAINSSTPHQARLFQGDFFTAENGTFESIEELWDGEV